MCDVNSTPAHSKFGTSSIFIISPLIFNHLHRAISSFSSWKWSLSVRTHRCISRRVLYRLIRTSIAMPLHLRKVQMQADANKMIIVMMMMMSSLSYWWCSIHMPHAYYVHCALLVCVNAPNNTDLSMVMNIQKIWIFATIAQISQSHTKLCYRTAYFLYDAFATILFTY